MLRIRKEQRDVFEADMRRRIRRKTLSDLQRERPDEFRNLGENKIRELIDLAESHVDRFGGDLVMDLKRFLYLMFDFGLNFSEDQEWATEVVYDSDIPGTGKVDVLEVYASQQPSRDSLSRSGEAAED